MKNAPYIAFILTGFALTSCQKEETPVVQNPGTVSQRDISVSYHIYAASAKFNATIIYPNGDQLETTTYTGTKMDQTISFDWKSGNKFSIEASNTTPSSDEIIVEILIDGILFKSGNANAPGAIAKAEGFVN